MAIGDEDPLSPTVMIQQYLRSQGLPLTAQNVHNVTMANARGDYGGAGMPVIPGMVNTAPPTDPGVGQRGNVARKVESSRPADLSQPYTGTQEAGDLPDQGQTKTTSAQPGPNISLGDSIMLGLPAVGLSGIGYGAWRLANRGGPQIDIGQVDRPTVGALPGPNPNAPQLPAPDPNRVFNMPDQSGGVGDQYRMMPTPDAQATSFDRAMGRAVEPSAPLQLTGPAMPLSGINPLVGPYGVRQGLPPGISDLDAFNAGISGTPTGPIADEPIVKPRVRVPAGRARVPVR